MFASNWAYEERLIISFGLSLFPWILFNIALSISDIENEKLAKVQNVYFQFLISQPSKAKGPFGENGGDGVELLKKKKGGGDGGDGRGGRPGKWSHRAGGDGLLEGGGPKAPDRSRSMLKNTLRKELTS